MRVVGWATFYVEGKFSLSMRRNVPTMKKRDFTAKEKDRSFAVEEVGGDPPTWGG